MLEEDVDNGEVEETLTAEELAREYGADPGAADERFLNEKLAVTGTIDRIDNVVSAVVPRMLGTGGKYSGTHLKFHLRNREDVDRLAKDEPATVHGVCRGMETSTSPTGERIAWITIDGAAVVETE